MLEVLTPQSSQDQELFQAGVAVFDYRALTGGLQGYYWDFPSYVNGEPVMNRGLFDSRTHSDKPKADLKQTLRDSLAERDRNLDDYKLKGHPIRWFSAEGRFVIPRATECMGYGWAGAV